MSKKAGQRLAKAVAIGGSQGAVEGLLQVVPHLPAELPAAIFVAIHFPVEADSYLPQILERHSDWRACHPQDGETITVGKIYIAPPDHHLTVDGREVHVRKGPRENRHRPAIDPLFRTVARTFGDDAIAVLLSGNLDDGSAGMFAVRARGGKAIIQDPADAQAAEMPQRALDYAGADYVLPAKEIAGKLIELINSRDAAMKGKKTARPARSTRARKTNGSDPEIRANEEVVYSDEGVGNPSVFACPECHGVLWEVKEGRLGRFRCRV
jgi:two-component system chemotaxis response regulator CheB